MTGKNKCKILKDIRRQIAEKNDIDLVIKECSFQGECKGTCPRCEAEVRFLEKELKKRTNLGKAVAIAGVVSLLATTATACTNADQNDAIPPNTDAPDSTEYSDLKDGEILLGELAPPETDLTPEGAIKLDNLLSNDKAGALEYMQSFTREQIQQEWGNYSVSTSTTIERYRIKTERGEFYVTIEFDANGKPIALNITEMFTSSLPTETGALELMGDVAFVPEDK